jgi:hypothetical protein
MSTSMKKVLDSLVSTDGRLPFKPTDYTLSTSDGTDRNKPTKWRSRFPRPITSSDGGCGATMWSRGAIRWWREVLDIRRTTGCIMSVTLHRKEPGQ